jgi:spore germination protein YaaH
MVVQLTDKGGVLASLLADGAKRSTAIDSIVSEAQNYNGVNLDFEGLGWNDTAEAQKTVQQDFNRFAEKLAEELHDSNLNLTLTLHPLNSAYKGYDYANLGESADRIIIMAYDYGPKPEPVTLVSQAVEMAAEKVPAQKLLLGITAVGETTDSMKTKIGIAKQYEIRGISLWRLGLITPQMWETLGKSVVAE